MELFKKKNRNWKSSVLLNACEKQIAELESSKLDLLTCLGQIFFANNGKKTVTDDIYGDTIQEICRINKELAFYENRKLEIQVVQRCEYCGSIVEVSPFCGMCGKRRLCWDRMPCGLCEERGYCLLRPKEEEEQRLLRAKRRAKSKELIENGDNCIICPKCGLECADAACFCVCCGYKLR